MKTYLSILESIQNNYTPSDNNICIFCKFVLHHKLWKKNKHQHSNWQGFCKLLTQIVLFPPSDIINKIHLLKFNDPSTVLTSIFQSF
jgi:hypothetical protein